MRKLFILTLLLTAFPVTAGTSPWEVVMVVDGDRLIISHAEISGAYSLYGIDCPELSQPYGSAARDYVEAMIADRPITVETVALGTWGRPLVKLYVDDVSLNEMLLKKGLAWVDMYYCDKKFCYQWQKIEEMARQAAEGLWQGDNPIPPWEWRRGDYRQEGAEKP
jgi:micrococcal nuclease